MLKSVKKVIRNPYKLYAWILTHIPAIGMNVSDKKYLSVLYRGVFGEKLNLDDPKHILKNCNGLSFMIENPFILKWLIK